MGSVVAGVSAVIGFLGSSSVAATSVKLAIALGSGAYQASQARKAKKLAEQGRNAYRNFRQPVTPGRIVYGRTRVAGPIIFAHNWSQNVAHLVICLANHEIEEVESVWVLKDEITYDNDDESSTYGRLTGKYADSMICHTFLGESGQDIGALLSSITDIRPGRSPTDISVSEIDEDDKFSGMAAIYAIPMGFSKRYEGATPDFSAIIKGKKIWDPRDDSTSYSPNGALCAADYLINYMGASVDSIDLDALTRSADIADETVDLKGGGFERRYDVNAVITGDQRHDEVLSDFATAIGGSIRYVSGKWIIEAGKAVDVSNTLYERNVLSEYELTIDQPDRASPTGVRGTFFDSATWQPASFPSYLDPDLSAAEGETWLDLELPFTTSHATAQRLARIALRRARRKRSMSLRFDLRGMAVRPGDVVRFYGTELGVENIPFEIDDWSFARTGDALGTSVSLVEYNPTAWDWDEDTDEADMVRGDVNLDSINATGIQGATVLESNLVTGAPAFSADYTFAWTNPTPADTDLETVDIDLEVTVTTDVTTHALTDSATVSDGSESELLSVNLTYPGAEVYVSHEITVAELQACFIDNTCAETVGAEEI